MFYYEIPEPYRDELLTAVKNLNEARYAIAAVYVLQLYEWVACIGREVPLVQLSRWTSIKAAYLLCRYYPLCIWPLVMWAYNGDHSADTCSQFASPVYGLLLPCQVFSQAVMLMRAYAFAGRNRRVLLLLGTCFAGLLGVNIWVFWSHIEVPPPLFYVVLNGSGCFPNYGEGTMGLRLGYSMLAALLMDLLSLAVVVVHCQKTRSQSISLARYFVRQGLGAFCFVTAVYVVTAILYFRPPSFNSGEGLPLILVFPNIVACRVILDLRRRASPTDSEISRRNSDIIRNAFEATPDEWAAGDENVMGISNIAPQELC